VIQFFQSEVVDVVLGKGGHNEIYNLEWFDGCRGDAYFWARV